MKAEFFTRYSVESEDKESEFGQAVGYLRQCLILVGIGSVDKQEELTDMNLSAHEGVKELAAQGVRITIETID